MFTQRLVLVTAIQTVGDRIAERVLRQTLATLALEGLGITGNALVTSRLVASVGTLPSPIANTGARQTCAVVALEGFLGTSLSAAHLLVAAVLAVLVFVAHKVPRDALAIATLFEEGAFMNIHRPCITHEMTGI